MATEAATLYKHEETIFNPDVFTPYSLAGTPEENKKDEADVKALAKFLKDTVIPRLVEDLCTAKLTPVDGVQLREIFKSRGVNMRYVGLVLSLALRAPQKIAVIPNMLYIELVSRCAKRIFRAKINAAPRHEWAVTAATLLNSLLSNASRDPVDCEKDAVSEGGLLWAEIKDVARTYFKFDLNDDSNQLIVGRHSQSTRMCLLRSVCLKTGIQIIAKEYDFSSYIKPAINRNDINDLVPLVKHTEIKQTIGSKRMQTAQHVQSLRDFVNAMFLYEQATVLLRSTFGGEMHPLIGNCCRSIALMASRIIPNSEKLCAGMLLKGTLVLERCLGVDSAETALAYVQLGMHFMLSRGSSIAHACLRHAQMILQLCAGPLHPEIFNIEYNIGINYLKQEKLAEARDCFLRALSLAKEMQLLHVHDASLALVHQLAATAYDKMGEMRDAMKHESLAYTLYSDLLGEQNPKSQECKHRLHVFTSMAVQKQRIAQDKRLPSSVQRALGSRGGNAPTDSRAIEDLLNYIEGNSESSKKKKKIIRVPTEQEQQQQQQGEEEAGDVKENGAAAGKKKKNNKAKRQLSMNNA